MTKKDKQSQISGFIKMISESLSADLQQLLAMAGFASCGKTPQG
jgi:hypothetical protein